MTKEGEKQCEQCKKEKNMSEFYRIINNTDGRMSICKSCVAENKDKQIQRSLARSAPHTFHSFLRSEASRFFRTAVKFLQRKPEKSLEELKEGKIFSYEERERALDEWFQLQPDKLCIACQERKKADHFGYHLRPVKPLASAMGI